jgi:tetratricopeptide (TPR) repeat protein
MNWKALLISLVLIVPMSVAAEDQAIEAARADFSAGRYADAVKKLKSALDQAPKDAAINYWLARAYYEQRNYDEAEKHGEAAVKLMADNAEYHQWLGRIYGMKAEQSRSFFLARKVKSEFEVAVRLAPRSIEARRDLMQYFVEAPWIVGGNKDKAREQVQAIAQLDPLEGRLAQARFLSEQKKWKEAETEYLAVLSQHPPRFDAYMEAADFFADRKDANNLDRVLADAERVNAKDPRLDF